MSFYKKNLEHVRDHRMLKLSYKKTNLEHSRDRKVLKFRPNPTLDAATRIA
jgi:hypothetical protein